ncbi:unnamed protein product [Enterobius vermicularis]|uniref:ANF_receptor domain-containing protein n=1 Tax=Enterobius vermicularis TaxID=51028 RepID=A0A0N4UUX2_ENTVE|nr:unnamed protein product [Enterobius vermicularis]
MKQFAFLLLNLKLFYVIQPILLTLLLLLLIGNASEAISIKNGRLKINNVSMPLNVLVMLPFKESAYDTFGLVMDTARPAIDKGLERAINHSLIIENQLNFTYMDSKLWEDQVLTERHTAVAMIEAYRQDRLDLMLGLADSYSIATLSKIGAGLGKGIPLITTAGFPAALSSRKSFTFLTRMRGSYDQMAESFYYFVGYDDPYANQTDRPSRKRSNGTRVMPVVEAAVSKLNKEKSKHIMEYKNMTFVYHDKKRAKSAKQHTNPEEMSSHCYFSLYAIKNYFTKNSNFYREVWGSIAPSVAFDEDQDNTTQKLVEVLKRASYTSNGKYVVISCFYSFLSPLVCS